MGLFDRLKKGLQKTRDVLRTDVRDLFKAGEILDDEKLEQFEARLIQSDMGGFARPRRSSKSFASITAEERLILMGSGKRSAKSFAVYWKERGKLFGTSKIPCHLSTCNQTGRP